MRSLSLPPPRRGSTKVRKPDLGQRPGRPRRDVAVELRDAAERQVVGLDPVVDRQLAELRHERPVAADDALTSPSWARRLRPALLAVAGRGGEHQRQVPRAPPSRGNAPPRPMISSSGVPMPTKPETATVSPSRMTATASSGRNDLVCGHAPHAYGRSPSHSAIPGREALRLAADEHADVAAGQRELGVVVGADLAAQRLRGRRRDDVVVLGVDVQDRHGDVPQVDLAAAELELALTSLFSW